MKGIVNSNNTKNQGHNKRSLTTIKNEGLSDRENISLFLSVENNLDSDDHPPENKLTGVRMNEI